MKILLTGREGQVGQALHRRLITLGDVIATSRDELDLNDHKKIISFIDLV
jgi:dTDP-4-dehydrorhamnose reductase